MPTKIPQPLSIGEETFLMHCRANHLQPVREYTFCPGRRFRFDFAWPDKFLAVEVEGGTVSGKSRHSFGAGFEKDCVKYNLAARIGWVVLRYSTAMVIEGKAITDVLELM